MTGGSTTVFTVKNVMESLAHYRDKISFDDLDGNMIFFGMESKEAQ